MPAARAHPSKKTTALSRCRLQRTWSDQPRSAPVCLRQHSPAHNVTFLANHDAPYAAYDRRVFQVLAGYAQHHPFALAHLSCVGWIGRPPSGSILVCAFGGGSDGRRPLRPAKSGRCWNEDGSRSSAMRSRLDSYVRLFGFCLKPVIYRVSVYSSALLVQLVS